MVDKHWYFGSIFAPVVDLLHSEIFWVDSVRFHLFNNLNTRSIIDHIREIGSINDVW